MRPETLGYDEWLTRRASILLGLGFWMAGFVLAGAAGRHVHRMSIQDTAADHASAVDTTESEATSFMPEDTIVGRPEPGAAQMQKP